MAEKFEVQGLKELEKKLVELDVETAQKTLRAAGRKAMKPVLDSAKSKVHVDTGDTLHALQITGRNSRDKRGVVVSVGATRKRALKSQGGHLLTGVNQKVIAQEFGTKKQKAEPFLRPALVGNAERVLGIFKTELAIAIDKAVK